jgi:hypothetical protein
LRSPGSFGLHPQRGFGFRTESEVRSHKKMVPRAVLKAVQL